MATSKGLIGLTLLGMALAFAPVAIGGTSPSPKPAAKPSTHKRILAKQQTAPAAMPPAPIVPLQPINLDQLPATPPRVSFIDGQLSIVAQNSTLAEILRAVKTQTGAVVEMPGSPNDRVVGHLGPGPARDVLASLLNGTRYNYVLLGSGTTPESLAHIILMAKTGNDSNQQANAQPPQYSAPPEQGPPGGGVQTQQAVTETEDDEDPEAADQTAQGQDEQADQNQQNQQKTPEQLLQELQRQQQIQQQLQNQPGGAGGPRFPGIPQQPPGQQPEQ